MSTDLRYVTFACALRLRALFSDRLARSTSWLTTAPRFSPLPHCLQPLVISPLHPFDYAPPQIYHIAADGTLLSSILPPDAFLPHNSDGNLDFATEDGSTIVCGRATNQGFEGLTISPDNTKLYVLLQSALVQDQVIANENVQYTRM